MSRSGWRLAWVAAIVVAIGACDPAAIVQGTRQVNDIIELEVQLPPPGADAEQAVAVAREAAVGIDREYGVDLSRSPDVVEYGIARCTEAPSCLGAEAGPGPWTVWHIRWQPDARASWIATLLDPTTGDYIWLGAGE